MKRRCGICGFNRGPGMMQTDGLDCRCPSRNPETTIGDVQSLIAKALEAARVSKAHHVVQPGEPPTHVRGRNAALIVTSLEDALLRCYVARGSVRL